MPTCPFWATTVGTVRRGRRAPDVVGAVVVSVTCDRPLDRLWATIAASIAPNRVTPAAAPNGSTAAL